jgi:hypothetical protein
MGASAKFQCVPTATLAALRAKPSLIESFLLLENFTVEVDGEVYTTSANLLAAVKALPTKRRQLRALRYQRDSGLIERGTPPPLPSGMPKRPRASTLDLGKEWHGVHYLVCGTARRVATPLGMAILGGRAFGPNLGYGKTRFLDAGQVKQVAQALGKCRIANLRRRFDPAAMTRQEVYPPGAWGDLDDPDEARFALGVLIDAFKAVRDYYRKAASAGNAMLLWQE